MGKNNKARRAAKAKGRQRNAGAGPARAGTGQGQHPFGMPFGDPQGPLQRRPVSPEGRWLDLEAAVQRGDAAEVEALAARMLRDDPVRGPHTGERLLLIYVDQLWSGGWQPVELVRQVRRKTSKAAAELIQIAIQVDHARRPGQAIDPRWAEQLAELDGRRASTTDGWLVRWGAAHAGEEAALAQMARVMAALAGLPELDLLLPPPGALPEQTVHGVPTGVGVDDPVLRRVRKLLAKAESTTFDDEADSLTAKAHELMTRHAIDQASLAEASPRDRPGTIRVAIDAPYADAKSLLLQIVAGSQRCRSIFHPGVDLSSVIGFASDLRAVELIFTSLLVQAQHALATSAGRAGSRARSPSYRSAFYLAYARRISERLQEVTAEVLSEVGEGAHLPVLRAREDAVADAFEQRFGASSVSGRVRSGYDPLGFAHGQRAADAARFGQEAIRA